MLKISRRPCGSVRARPFRMQSSNSWYVRDRCPFRYFLDSGPRQRPLTNWPSGEVIRLLTFKHDDLTLALTLCSCCALREVAVFVRECGKCKPLYASLIERCKTLPSVHGRINNPFASSAVTCTMSQFRTSSERKQSLSATRQPFTVEIALLFVFSLSNSLFFVSFLRISYLSHTQEQAGSMPWMQAVGIASPGHSLWVFLRPGP